MGGRTSLPGSVAGRLATAVVFLAGVFFFGILPSAGGQVTTAAPRQLARMCGALKVIHLPDGRAECTHGPDPAPPGVDFRVARPLDGVGRTQGQIFPDPPGDGPTHAAGTPGIGCYGDGQDGQRVQAIYAVPADQPDRYDQVAPFIRQWAAETDAVFQASAAQTGGIRRIRFLTDASCNLVVTRAALSPWGDDTFEDTIVELEAQGFDRSDRKYLVWMDSTELCGIATYYVDSRVSADNYNNGPAGVPASFSRIDSGCWGLASRGQSVEAHELMHSLGAVLPNAPNGTLYGHCSDDDDLMCYADGSPLLVLRSVCPSDQEPLFDCEHDDYFSTAPPTASWLATHWNGAANSFLATTFTSPTVSIADAVATEGDANGHSLSFAVTLSAPDPRPVSVSFSTVDGSARAPDDYQAASGTVTFNPGETAKSVTVPINDDSRHELDETLSLRLSTPSNARLGRTEAFGTIIDDDPLTQGYWFVASDGGIFAFGDAGFFGSTGNIRLNQPIVGMASTPSGNGYWLVATDGGIFAFGDAGFFGSTGNIRLNQPIVGMASTPSGNGYWFVARDGGIFAFGDARFFGAPDRPATAIVGMAASPTGNGYWCVGRDGTVYGFGDADFYGSPPKSSEVAGLAPSRTGRGYWLASTTGAVYAFGDARHFGGTGNLVQPVVGLASTPEGGGYWLVARDGGIFSFGDARFSGSTGNIRLNQPIVGMTATHRAS